MNHCFSDQEDQFRTEVRRWLEDNVPESPLASGDSPEGFAQHVVWEKRLYAAGLAAVSWPKRYGGRDASLVEWLIFEEEYYRAGAPIRVTQNGIFLLAPTIFEYGTPEQKERILRPMLAAEYTWGQAWSEPNAGSDLANVQCRAERVSGGWRLNGQKTWCTRGMYCDGVHGLFRTEAASTRHKGLTYFMISLDAPGVHRRGVQRLDGHMSFAEIFFEDVFVPDHDVIGEVGRGWYVAMSTTSSERGLTLRSPGRFTAASQRLVDLYCRSTDPSPTRRQAVIETWIDAQAYRWYTYATVTKMIKGESIGAASSLDKVFWSELDLSIQRSGLALLGDLAELESGVDAVDEGRWMADFLFALAGPIYAGTNEIQRNVVAERLLGLPRR